MSVRDLDLDNLDDDDLTLADIDTESSDGEDWASRDLAEGEVETIDINGGRVLMGDGTVLPIVDMELPSGSREGRLVAGPQSDGGWIFLDFSLVREN